MHEVSRELWWFWPEELREKWVAWFAGRGFVPDEIRDFRVGRDRVELSLIHKGAEMKPHSGVHCPDDTAERLGIPPNELCQFETLLVDAQDHPEAPKARPLEISMHQMEAAVQRLEDLP